MHHCGGDLGRPELILHLAGTSGALAVPGGRAVILLLIGAADARPQLHHQHCADRPGRW
jgi:hypothetical protein